MVVNDAMAKIVWPGRGPLGRCVRFGTRANPCYTVVGIVETARRGGVIEEPTPQYYFSLSGAPESGWEGMSTNAADLASAADSKNGS
jgi:hypothetical protein